jgi:HYR domain/Kelch motif/Galactose oxidase, central domain
MLNKGAVAAGRALILSASLLGMPADLLAAGGFTAVGGLVFGRSSAAVVTLPDASVLVVSDNSVERYDPATRFFSFAGWLLNNHGSGLSATLLTDGKVLIVGGQFNEESQASAEIYDPATGTSTATGSMGTLRSYHAAARLDDGRVLVAGGHQFNFYNSALASAELYDPGTGTFSPVGDMATPRQDATATPLAGGGVLVVGGYDANGVALSSAEVYDAPTGGFAATGSMLAGRGNHAATPLGDARILVTGGHAGFPASSLASAEIYDPASGAFSSTGYMSIERGAHTAVLLSDGKVLVAGGFTAFPFLGQTLASAEIYDPVTGVFTGTHGMRTARGRHVSAALPGGDALVAGGMNFSVLSDAELFSPTFEDTEPPVLTVPADFTVGAFSPGGTTVFYFVSATDNSDGNPVVSCQPASGTFFPTGTNTVECTATDSWDNSARASFRVTVLDPIEVTLTVDAFASVDPATGVATVFGTLACSRNASASVNGELDQTVASRAQLRGFFSIFGLVCGPAPQPWSAPAVADNGRFAPGKAFVFASAFAFDGYTSAAMGVERSIQLRAKGKK